MVNTDVLPLIIFALVFGGVLTTLGEKGSIVIRFFEGVNEAIMGIVHLLMWVAPIGIGALIAGRLGEAGGFVGFWPQLKDAGSLCRNGHSRTHHPWPDCVASCAEVFRAASRRGLRQSDEYSFDDGLFHEFKLGHASHDHGKLRGSRDF